MPESDFFLNNFFTSISLVRVLWIAYAVSCLVFLGHFVIAAYHWHTFGSERATSLLSMAIYGGVGLFLLMSMGLSLLAV